LELEWNPLKADALHHAEPVCVHAALIKGQRPTTGNEVRCSAGKYPAVVAVLLLRHLSWIAPYKAPPVFEWSRLLPSVLVVDVSKHGAQNYTARRTSRIVELDHFLVDENDHQTLVNTTRKHYNNG
jgi:hypothetical protein